MKKCISTFIVHRDGWVFEGIWGFRVSTLGEGLWLSGAGALVLPRPRPALHFVFRPGSQTEVWTKLELATLCFEAALHCHTLHVYPVSI